MISFRYELEGTGWADAYLGDGTDSATIPASYLCDALRDLVDAIQSLFTTDSAECVWHEEPGEVKWRFARNGDSVELRVEWWNEIRTHPDRDEWHFALDKVMFSGQAKFLDFATQVDQELRRLLEKWGLDGYLREWIEHPFPGESHQRLRQCIAVYETADRPASTGAVWGTAKKQEGHRC
jgi:hypothetical protein